MSLRAETGPVDTALLEGLPALVSRAAHDLNNSLARILGKAELALMLGDESRYRRSLEEVVEAGQSARILVSDLQRFMAWCRASEESIFTADVVALVSRLARRTCRKLGLELESVGGGAPIEPPAAAASALASLALLQAAHELADPEDPRCETWRFAIEERPGGTLTVRVDSPAQGPLFGRLAAQHGIEKTRESLAGVGARVSRSETGFEVEIPVARV